MSSTMGQASSITSALVPTAWDLAATAVSMFPKEETDRLNDEHGYLVWAIQMWAAFDLCGLLELIEGNITKPSARHASEPTWKKINAAARLLILKSINSLLVMKVSHLTEAKEMWDLLAGEYTQAGSDSITYWLCCLMHIMPLSGNILAHINEFQEAIHYLVNANFLL